MVMADADVVVVLLDGSEEISTEDDEILEGVRGLSDLIVVNKIDKIPAHRVDELISDLRAKPGISEGGVVAVSAKTGEGLDVLKRSILQPFKPPEAAGDGFLVTDARHYDLLIRSRDEILASISAA